MPGFVRRYGFFPGTELITLVEGVIIIDLPPPGRIEGVAAGVVGLVGEFAECSNAAVVDANGAVTRSVRPVEIFSGQDLLDKLGAFDETIGAFGTVCGNGFAALRNKKFSRLVVAPVNLASSRAVRVWRDLPTNTSALNPNAVVPVQGALVLAGREFRAGANRVRLAARVQFQGLGHYANGTDGAVTAAGAPAATQNFVSAGSNFLATGATPLDVRVGDILVVGVIGAAGAQGANARTYRVNAVTNATTLVVERMDGTTFDWTTGVALAWRLHRRAAADSSTRESAIAAAGGYSVLARPMDATVTQGTVLTPTVAPAAAGATSWDILSGLSARVVPGAGNDLVYTAAVQAANAANSANLNTEYQAALDALGTEDLPARAVNVVWAARKSEAIANALVRNADAASNGTPARVAVVAPGLGTAASGIQAVATALGAAGATGGATGADYGVGDTAAAGRSDRAIYCWPGVRTLVPEANTLAIAVADGTQTTDGVLDDPADGWMASILSNLAPERNPGQGGPPVDLVMRPVLGLQRAAPTLTMNEYIAFRQQGIAAPRMDRVAGGIFQSGITTSLTAGRKNVSRRRMTDFITDSWAQRMVTFTKQPLTEQLKNGIAAETNEFLSALLSRNNPAAQRIAAFSVDIKSGNTPDLEAQGIFVVIVRVRLLATADFIVLQSEIGEGVKITEQAA